MPHFWRRPQTFEVTLENVSPIVHPDDTDELRRVIAHFSDGTQSYETEFRIFRPDGEVRWCVGTAAATLDTAGHVDRVSGVTVDITERKQAEERSPAGARSRPSRRNTLALVQAIVRLTRAENGRPMSARWRDASTRSHGCTPCFRRRAGKAPTSES